MIFESAVFSALFFGLLSAATLPLGAAVGVVWRPPERVLSFLLAFGSGALLAALTIDLIAPGVDRGHFEELAIGAILGGILFKTLDWAVNRKGGYLRKPSTAMTYWRDRARERLEKVLGSVRRTAPLGNLSAEAEDALLSVMQVQEVPGGSCLYRANDPASHLYIIDEGAVELSDPARGGRVFERLGPHDVFGRMSFIAGLRRATEAHTTRDTKLLVIPRDAFMELLPGSPELRRMLAARIDNPEVHTYLQERHGLDADAANAWREQAREQLAASGRYDPPIEPGPVPEGLISLLRDEPRLEFFRGLSDATLERVASRLIHKTNPAGFGYFHLGQPADRFYFLRRGTLSLVDPDDRSRLPTVVHPGESFGGLSFLTEGTHAVTAVGNGKTEISALRHRDFEDLLEELPELRRRLTEFLRRHQVAEYLTVQHNLDAKRAASWVEKAAKSIEGGRIFPSLTEMTRTVAGHQGAAMAMFLGILLDGIPESFVIGANVLATGGISLSLIGGLVLANLPEALSSAAGMKEQGMGVRRILLMWTSLMVMTGLGAALGAVMLAGASDQVFALIEGLAAGAMLTMVAETMLPEAFHKGGGIVGISTLAGFLAAIYLNTLG